MTIRTVATIMCFIGGSGWAATSSSGSAGEGGDAGGFAAVVKPAIETYCFGCHGMDKEKGGINLDVYQSRDEARQGREVWAKVLRVLSRREMPPEGKPQPEAAERDRLIGAIQDEIFPLDCAKPDPGRVTIRRLNRTEYNATIRDLVGVTFEPAEDFPADDSGYGFDTIGDVLSLSPLLMEKYLAAAEKIVDAACPGVETRRVTSKRFGARSFQTTGGGGLAGACCFRLFSEGTVYVDHIAPTGGVHRLRVCAYGEQAGPERVKMKVRIDGQELRTFEVPATVDAPGEYEVEVRLTSGRRRLGVEFANDYYNPGDANPVNRDRNLVVHWMELTGPVDAPASPEPASYRRIFICEPEPGREEECSRKILGNFARRAFRRPPRPAELEGLMALAASARQAGEAVEESIKLAMTAILVSPSFLFRGEVQADPDNPLAVHAIDDWALASRLSYFLWSSMPDEELFRLAEAGTLRRELEPQVRRMLRDPKARALAENFGGQWLQTRNLGVVQPDPAKFPDYDGELSAAMREEIEHFFDDIRIRDRSVLEFLTADYTFVNERLARFYGLPGVAGGGFRRVSLAGTPRGGVLTMGSVLTITSNPTRTSPVKRGKWVLENLLNAPPPPPPPNVPELEEAGEAAAGGTLRQRMEQHRADPGCASCHALMDPIGFGLENFDGIGSWREKDGEAPVDASGRLNTGESFAGAAELREILATAKRHEFVRCLAEKMLTYALGRGLEYYDRCAVDRLMENVARQDYRFSAMVREVAGSVPFLMRRGDGDPLARSP